jgi:ubiquitin related modifier 1
MPEILFSNERKHNITLPARLDDASQPTIAYLLQHLVDNLMKDDRKELFIMEDNVYARSILDLELCYVMY